MAFPSDLVVGARSREALEQALREVLPGLGLAVARVVDVANVSERHEQRGDEGSISIGALDEAIFTVAVGLAAPSGWQNELARRLSLVLGGWSASRDGEELGFFLDGSRVEMGSSGATGFEVGVADIAGEYVEPWPPSGGIRVLFVEGAPAVRAARERAPSTLLVVVGHAERLDIPGYDFALESGRVLLARTHVAHEELRKRLDAIPCAAFYTNMQNAYVRRRDDAQGYETLVYDLRTMVSIWQPVCWATRIPPLGFTFDAPAKTPWR